jgi:sterol 3beta-glucosyltransferase
MTAPDLPLGKSYHRLTYKMGDLLWGFMTTRHVSEWRKNAGLPKLDPLAFPYRQMNGRPVQTLYAFSPTLVPQPSGWGNHIHITGFWFLGEEQDWQALVALTRFLESDTQPLYIGFGSMVGGSFPDVLEMILAALRKAHLRAVLSSGWGNLTQADMPDFVYKRKNFSYAYSSCYRLSSQGRMDYP